MSGLEVLGLVGTLLGTAVSLIALNYSLSFYREGSQLQKDATILLAQISEKASSIQNEVSSVTKVAIDASLKSPDAQAIIREITSSLVALRAESQPKVITSDETEDKKIYERRISELENQLWELETYLDSLQNDVTVYYDSIDIASAIKASTSRSELVYVTDLVRMVQDQIALKTHGHYVPDDLEIRYEIHKLWANRELNLAANNYYTRA